MHDQEKPANDINSLKEIFNTHKAIFKTYTDVHVPKQLLKDMKKDLQEYYNQLNNTNTNNEQQVQEQV